MVSTPSGKRQMKRHVAWIIVFMVLLGTIHIPPAAAWDSPEPDTPIDFVRKNKIFVSPGGVPITTVALGPDGRLYTSNMDGTIYALTLDESRNVINVQQINTIYNTPNFNEDGSPAPGVEGRLLLGMTFDPQSTPSQPVMYVSHSDPRSGYNAHDPSTFMNLNSGTITRLTGPNFDSAGNRLDVVTGLPRSRKNHATNGITFGPDGWLYIAQGGHTDVGAPHHTWGSLPEFYLSAAVLRANVHAIGSSVDVSEVDSAADLQPLQGQFEIFATGFRNMYDLVWHSNGDLYANENGANEFQGTTPGPEHGCPDGEAHVPNSPDDTFWKVTQGLYAGNPNPARGECIFRDGSLYDPPKTPEPNYQPPLRSYSYNQGEISMNGIAEYPVGAMAGNLIVTPLTGGLQMLERVILNPDGSATIARMDEYGSFQNPLDVAIDADGAIYVAEFAIFAASGVPGISVLIPESITTPELTLTGINPNSGTVEGGTSVTLTGTLFESGTTVAFDGVAATDVTFVNSTTITATTPAHAEGTVTVSVTNPDSESASLPNGFTYTVPGSAASLVRVNAGGQAYTDTSGASWEADNGASSGNTYVTTDPVTGTADPTLYQSERFGNFTYDFALENGDYTVKLKFAEIFWTNPGQRVFNVAINGQQVLTNFDILTETDPFTALDKSFPVTVTNGNLSIMFTTLADNAKISAIEVLGETGDDTTPPTISSTNPADGATDVPLESSVSVTFSEPMNKPATEAAFTLDPTHTGSFSWNASGTTMTFTPAAVISKLRPNQLYTAAISTGATDLAGNTIVDPAEWTFTTLDDTDTTPPTIESIDPADGATNVAPASAISVEFSEPMNQAATESAFSLSPNQAGVFSWDTTGTTMTFTPNDNLLEDTDYTVNLTTDATDQAGNSIASSTSWTFTTTVPISGTSLVRINSGGGSFAGSTGTWTADTSFIGGNTYSISQAIAGTSDDTLYQSERYGSFSYAIPIENGDYTVTLKFAEIFWTSPGQRVFNVALNGQPVLTNFDILAETSPFTALDKSFPVTVTNGTLAITVSASVDLAKISAIEILGDTGGGGEDTTPPTVNSTNPADDATNVSLTSTVSVTFSEPMNQAAAEDAFELSPSVAGSFAWNGTGTTMTFTPDAALAEDTLYTATVGTTATDLAGNALTAPVSWSFTTVPPGSEPAPTLASIDPTSGSTAGGTSVTLTGSNFVSGASVTFDGVAATNVVVVNSTTIDATTPAHDAGTVGVTVTNPDGQSSSLAGAFTYVEPPSGDSLVRINAGGNSYAGSTGDWSADTGFSAGSTFTTTQSIAGTSDDPLYQSERYGNFSYSIPIQNGDYTVTLKFAEVFWTTPGKRVFSVAINGQQVLTNFDIVAEAGAFTALDKSFPVTVTNGTLAITVSASVDYAKISAIEILGDSGGGGEDTTPPTVSSTNPADDATNVPFSSTISVTFSEPMNQAATEDAFTLDPAVAGSFSWSGTTMTFTPNEALTAEQLYTATVSTDATDVAGNALTAPVSWSFTTTSAGDPELGQWTTMPPMPEARSEVGVVELNGIVYVLGGSFSQGLSNKVFAYDIADETWSEVAPYPGPAVDHAGAAAVDGLIYIIGGLTRWPDQAVNTVYAYDPATNSWSERANLPRDRGAMGVAVLGGKIYAAGGLIDGGTAVTDLAAYDPLTNAWTELAPMPTPRDHLSAEAINGLFYALGGRPVHINQPLSANEAYDPVSNSWESRASLPVARAGHGSAVLNGKIVIFGGEGNPASPLGVFENTDEYDPLTNSWRSLAPMVTPRHGMDGATYNDVIYVPGGGPNQGGSHTTTHEAFSMLTETSMVLQTTFALGFGFLVIGWFELSRRRSGRRH